MAQSVLSEGPTLIELDHLPPAVIALLQQGLPEGTTLDLSAYATDAEVAAAVAGLYAKPAGGIPASDLDMVSVAAAPDLAAMYGPEGTAGNASRVDVEANTAAIASLTGQVAASGGGVTAVLTADIAGTSTSVTVTLPAGTYDLDGTVIEYTSTTTTGKNITASISPTSGSFGRMYTSQTFTASTATAPSSSLTTSVGTATGAAYQYLSAGASATSVTAIVKTSGVLTVAAEAQVRVTWTSTNVGITAVAGTALTFTRRF